MNLEQDKNPNKLLDKKGIAKVIGVSLQKLDKMIQAGEIPYIRLGKLYRFHTGSVIQGLIESHSGGLALKQDVKVILG